MHVYHQVCGGLDVSLMRRMTSAQDEKEDHPNIRLYSNFFFLFFCSSLFLSCVFSGEFGWKKKKRWGGFAFSESGALVIYTVVGGALLLGFFPWNEGRTDRALCSPSHTLVGLRARRVPLIAAAIWIGHLIHFTGISLGSIVFVWGKLWYPARL